MDNVKDIYPDHDNLNTLGFRYSYSKDEYYQLASALLPHNGSQFLTSDRIRKLQGGSNNDQQHNPPDQQLTFIRECSQMFQSGWWYGRQQQKNNNQNNNQQQYQHKLSKPDACKMANGFQLMAPIDNMNNGRKSKFFTGNSYNNHQHHSTRQSLSSSLSMYWSKWTNDDNDGDGDKQQLTSLPSQLRYVLMKIRPENFHIQKND